MKKYVLIGLLGLSTSTFSCTKCMCKYLFDIIVVNATAAECVLTNQTIKNGSVYSKTLPLRIAANQQSERYTFEYDLSNRQTEVSLSFQCGNEQFATFLSERKIEWGLLAYTEIVNGTVTAAAGIDASFVDKAANCAASKPTPRTIYWTLHS